MSEIPAPAAGENLYGWTDENRVGVNLYKWTETIPTMQLYAWTYNDCTIYTQSATPNNGDSYYDANGNDITGTLTVNGNSFGNCMIDYYQNNQIRVYVEPA